MKLVGLAIKNIALDDANITDFIGQRFYNSLAPQGAAYPLAVGYVLSVSPVDSKMNRYQGRALTDTYGYRISVFSFEPEQAARMAIAFRNKFDRPKPGKYKDIQINTCRMIDAAESGFKEDDVELYTWNLDFEIRVDEIFPVK